MNKSASALKSCSPGQVKAINLAYIIGTYPSLTTTFIDREIRVMRQLGACVRILSLRRPVAAVSQIDDYRQMQMEITYLLPLNWLLFTRAHLFFALLQPLVYFGTLVFLFTRSHSSFKKRLKTVLHFAEGVFAAFHLRDWQCDHVHAHFVDRATTVALVVERLLKLPYSFTAHARSIFEEPVLINEKFSSARFAVTVSNFNKNYLLRKYRQLDASRIYVLHPWINLEQFCPPHSRPINVRLQIVSVGRLVEKKGHRYLIGACHRLQEEGLDFECTILGDGPLKAELEEEIAHYKLQDRLHLLGGQPQEEVLNYLCRADIFVLACVIASNGDRDAMPVALAEAMAMELPVISTKIVGINELVKPGAGILVPPNDAVALATAIKNIQAIGFTSRVRMGQYGRTIIADEFELFKGVTALADLFEQSIQKQNLR